MDKEPAIRTLERLAAVYESRMQAWTVANGVQGSPTSPFHGLDFGYQTEVEALRAAIEIIRRHGVPSHGIGMSGNYDQR